MEQINKIAEIDCSICMEKTKNIRKNNCHVIKCYTCEEGFICNDCIPKVDPHGSIFLSKRKQLEKAIRCPCCRTLNWNYQYNQLIGIIIAEDMCANEDNYAGIPALDVFLRNRYL